MRPIRDGNSSSTQRHDMSSIDEGDETVLKSTRHREERQARYKHAQHTIQQQDAATSIALRRMGTLSADMRLQGIHPCQHAASPAACKPVPVGVRACPRCWGGVALWLAATLRLSADVLHGDMAAMNTPPRAAPERKIARADSAGCARHGRRRSASRSARRGVVLECAVVWSTNYRTAYMLRSRGSVSGHGACSTSLALTAMLTLSFLITAVRSINVAGEDTSCGLSTEYLLGGPGMRPATPPLPSCGTSRHDA